MRQRGICIKFSQRTSVNAHNNKENRAFLFSPVFLSYISPTCQNACFSLIFPEKSAFRNGFELRRSDVKKDFFFNIFRRRSVESSSDNFRFFPTNTVSFDIYQKTRNQLNSKEFRGFESHRLRQVSLLNSTLGSDFLLLCKILSYFYRHRSFIFK